MTKIIHKDIEKILSKEGEFRLYDNFMDENGLCMMGGSEYNGRKSLQEPHEASNQIYRGIFDRYGNTLGLVRFDGDVRLVVEARSMGAGNFRPVNLIRELVNQYIKLKRMFDNKHVKYSSDHDFEKAVIESAKIISGQ